jgi:hypothetical protein
MRSIAIALLSLVATLAPGCASSHHADDAGVPADAGGGPPDGGVAGGPTRAITRAVSGSVKASSAHYQLIGTTSAGGGPAASTSYQHH